jgi:Ankyrin repeats (3 copies)
MPTIQDKAEDGSLNATDLQANIKQINEVGGNVKLTPLAAACKGGHLRVVKLLLEHNADPDKRSPPPQERTALFYATARTSAPTDRLAIVQALISKADINLACDEDGNTPLMNAIVQMRAREDFPVVHLLVDNNASQTQPNKQRETARTLADAYKMSRHLRSKDERNTSRAKIVDLVVSFVLLIVAYTNSFSVKMVTDGIVKQLYSISGKKDANLVQVINILFAPVSECSPKQLSGNQRPENA